MGLYGNIKSVSVYEPRAGSWNSGGDNHYAGSDSADCGGSTVYTYSYVSVGKSVDTMRCSKAGVGNGTIVSA